MKKARIFALIMCLVLALGSLTACGETEAQSVSTDGSTSMEKVMGYFMEAFMEENENITVTYNPTGSGSGIQAVIDGTCDIGLASRNLKDEELETCDQTVVAIDGIAVIVNTENTVSDLTIAEIAAIFTGEITNWSEVGGEDLPIVCIGREASSGTRDGFEPITGTADACVYSQELTSTGDVVSAVSSNPNAIGYVSLASVNDTVSAISVEGVYPTSETVLDGTYQIQRNFVFVTKKDTALSDAAQAFYDYCTSSAVNEYIEAAGCVPVN